MLSKEQSDELYDKFKDFLESKSKEVGVALEEFLEVPSEKNVVLHNEILKFIAETFKERSIINEYRFYQNDKCGLSVLDKKRHTDQYPLLMTMYLYTMAHLGTYYTVTNGNIIFSEYEKFDTKEDSAYYVSRIKAGRENKLQLLVLPDGDTYFAPRSHLELSKWLIANNIPIKGAIRVEVIDGRHGEFLFSSLYNHGFSKESTSQRYTEITPEQAKTLATLYSRSEKVGCFGPLKSVTYSVYAAPYLVARCAKRDMDETSKHNLSVLEDAFGSRTFSSSDYFRAVKDPSIMYSGMSSSEF